ncbi:DUF1559 family PulG-like putative transporter [Paludisphaera soli]|uniref:DUF1559 family PulG-like putative transporter n=1 Tax=Paludisphaera soli TaxID=2712865 RepID=UPI0013EDDD5F|nr:DUF1559 domain-containing protein [Paludisphaera soli]
MESKPSRGITLLEVFVILSIVAVLVALLLPSVTTRCYSSRIHCVQNLKQLALAAYVYESTWGCFPPGFGPTPIHEVGTYPRPSPLTALLPELGRCDVYDAFNFEFGLQGVADHPTQDPNGTAAGATISQFLCPTDRWNAGPAGLAGCNNYFASIGATACPELGPAPPHYPANRVEVDLRLAGIFNARLDHAAPTVLPDGSYNPANLRVAGATTLADVADGTASTALFSETLRSTASRGEPDELAADSPLNVFGVLTASFTTSRPPPVEVCRGGRRIAYRGQRYYRAASATSFYSHTLPPNAAAFDCANVDSDFVCGHVAARSLHPGVVNVAFADGTVRSVKNSIAPPIWSALGTRAGGEALPTESP